MLPPSRKLQYETGIMGGLFYKGRDQHGPWDSVAEIKKANRNLLNSHAAGGHWFSHSTMRFFNSRVGRRTFFGRYFISSEQAPPDFTNLNYPLNITERRYTIREARPDCAVDTPALSEYETAHHAFQAFKSYHAARSYLLKNLNPENQQNK